MAEAFGVAAGAVGIAALFNNCVECFDYVQMARNFGRDYHTAQLRLDLAKVQLTRWGQAVNINGDSLFTSGPTDDKTEKLAKETLWQILLLFSDAAKASGKYEADASAYYTDVDMSGSFKSCHEKLRELTHQRQKSVGVFKKAAWALHHGKEVDKLTRSITDFIDRLEKLLPPLNAGNQYQQLVGEEVALLDENDLNVVSEVADDKDKLLAAAVETELENIDQRNKTGDLNLSEQAKVRIGDEWADIVISSGYKPPASAGATVGNIQMSGKAKLHVGRTIGGGSLMDGD